MKKVLTVLMAFFACVIGIYPVIYFIIDRRFGLLASKSDQLLADTLWNICFYAHIILGGLALLIGWIQFNQKIRTQYSAFHRRIGTVYVFSVLLSALAGIGIGINASGGWISSLGFICLGVVWFTTTLLAFLSIKNGQIVKHQILMIYSYAACFAAVTLRIWLPLLSLYFNDAYLMVAWLCWVPNLIVAYLIIRNMNLQTKSVITPT